MENVGFFNNSRRNNGTSIAVWNQGSSLIKSCTFSQNEFDVNVYNYQGESTISLSTFEKSTGQSSIGITGGYTGISGCRFVGNIYPGSANIEAKSGYVDINYCEFFDTSAQADIISYGKRGSLFMEYLCFISGDYAFTPVFVGSDATLEESLNIYADDLKERDGQECVGEAGVFTQDELSENNYTYCFDNDASTACVGICKGQFDASTCNFKTPRTEAPSMSPSQNEIPNRVSSSSSRLGYESAVGKYGGLFLLGWIFLIF